MNKRANHWRTTSAVLIIILLLVAGHFVYTVWSQRRIEGQFATYQAGFQEGYTQAVGQLIQEAGSCQPIPVFFENKSVELISVACLSEVS